MKNDRDRLYDVAGDQAEGVSVDEPHLGRTGADRRVRFSPQRGGEPLDHADRRQGAQRRGDRDAPQQVEHSSRDRRRSEARATLALEGYPRADLLPARPRLALSGRIDLAPVGHGRGVYGSTAGRVPADLDSCVVEGRARRGREGGLLRAVPPPHR